LFGFPFQAFQFIPYLLFRGFILVGFHSDEIEIGNPNSFEEAVKFLSNFSCIDFPNQFEYSVNFIANKFSLVTSKIFSKLLTKSIEYILSPDQLVLPNEAFLFELILQDERKNYFFQFLIFPTIDFEILFPFLQQLHSNDENIYLYGILKQLCFFDSSSILMNRWIEKPLFLCFQDISALLNDFKSFQTEHLSSGENDQSLSSLYFSKIQNLQFALESEKNNVQDLQIN
jgi:hypothetical protein